MSKHSEWGAALDVARSAADGTLDVDPPVALSDIRGEVLRLANLDSLAYEHERQETAKRLGVRSSVLDAEVAKARPNDEPEAEGEVVETLEPWPEPVDGASLLEEVRDRLRAHVVFASTNDVDAATLWIAGTYLMDAWRLWPRLMITSPTKQCGKSTLLEVIDALGWRGLIVSNTKSAGVFRAIEAWRPTLLFDEADTWMREDVELAGILNSGHTRRTARVIRVQERSGELVPTLFSTWAPMVIAGIGEQRDTLTSRSIVIGLRRRLPSETAERLPIDLHERMFRVRRQLARWTSDNKHLIEGMEIEPPDCGNDRRRDNFTPLWRIAAALGNPWPDRIAAAYMAQAATNEEADEPAGVMALRDIGDLFAGRQGNRVPSGDVLHHFLDMEDRPWPEWRHGKPLTARSLAKLLKPFSVRPRDWKTSGRVVKAYDRGEVEAAVARYASDYPLPRYSTENIDKNGHAIRYSELKGSGAEAEKDEQSQPSSGVADKSEAWDDFEALDDPNDPEAWR